jgi:hypothetical protein
MFPNLAPAARIIFHKTEENWFSLYSQKKLEMLCSLELKRAAFYWNLTTF